MLTFLSVLVCIILGSIGTLVICGVLGLLVGVSSIFVDLLYFLISGGALLLLVVWLVWHFWGRKQINKKDKDLK